MTRNVPRRLFVVASLIIVQDLAFFAAISVLARVVRDHQQDGVRHPAGLGSLHDRLDSLVAHSSP